MSRHFPDASANYLYNANAILTAAPITVAAWFTCDTALPLHDMVIWSDSNGTILNRFRLLIEGSSIPDRGTIRWAVATGGTSSRAQTSTVISADTWHHACGVEAASNDRRVYLDGGGKGINSAIRVPAGVNQMYIGRCVPAAPDPMDGRLGHISVWNIALTDSEVATLAAGISPLMVHRNNLVGYWPINGQSPEPDFVGGYNMTLTGTIPKSEEPSKMIGRRIIAP